MTNIKTAKIKLSVLLLMATIAFLPLLAAAATLSLSPVNVSVTQGQTFIVNVALNPQDVKTYTVKVELRYPANLLEVRSFAFSNNWLPLTQPGYDSVDNSNGVLIKTAGYPGGASSPVTFGTVSFRAKATGNAGLTISANSSAYDAASKNSITGLPVLSSVTINAPVSTPTTHTAPTTGEVLPSPTPGVEEETGEEEVAVSEPKQGFSLFAAIGRILTLGTDRVWVTVLLIVAILSLVYYLIRYLRMKKI